MKKLIVVSIASLLLSSTYANAEWVMPKDIDRVEINEAKMICQSLNGRVPNSDDFEKLITDCGGLMGDFNNKNNQNYQSCYQRRGFDSKKLYWMSDELMMGLKDGTMNMYSNEYDRNKGYFTTGYIMCVRGQ